MIPIINSLWTSEQSPNVLFLEVRVNNAYVLAVYAYGMVWEVKGI